MTIVPVSLQIELTPASPRRLQTAAGAALLLGLIVLAYWPAVAGDFLWDDDAYVSQNELLPRRDGLSKIWFEIGATPQYYPLVFTSFWCEYRVWGLEPAGFHLVNIVLHGLSALVLWRVLRELRVGAAWLGAALFALHPVHVESVAWITERKNALSALFYLLAALSYLRWLDSFAAGTPWRRNWPRYGLALVCFVCALLSKTVTCTLPAALVLLAWYRRGRVDRRELTPLLPLFAIGAGFACITVWMERHHVGTKHVDWDLSLVERTLIAGRAIWFYAAKLVWPFRLTFIYPRWDIDARVWQQYVFPLGVLAVMAALGAARWRIGRGPFTGVLFFVVTLLPALGFVDVYPMRFSFVADHFQYLASIGLLVVAAATWHRLAVERRASQSLYAAGSAVLLLGLALLTWRQCHVYRDSAALWQDTFRKNPNSQLVRTTLGVMALEARHYGEAREHLEAALKLDPSFESAHLAYAVLLRQRGDADGAILHLNRTLEIDPGSTRAHLELARHFRERGDHARAMSHYDEALRIDPQLVEALVESATMLQEQGLYDQSLSRFRRALALNSEEGVIYYNLGVLLEAMQRAGPAEEAYREALQRNPQHVFAHFNLGNVLARQQRFTEAVEQYQAALRGRPDFTPAAENLRAAQGDLERQRQTFRPPGPD